MYEYLDRRYALALYEVAEEKGKVEEYIRQLVEVVDIVYNTQDLMKLIKHPQISTARKKETFKAIFEGKIEADILSFLLILIEKDRILYLKEKLNQMEKIYLERHDTIIATIKTVVPLLENERETLVQKLEKKYKKKILVEEQIDESLLGGVYVKIGDDVIDGTVKSKLEEMKALMLKGV